MAGTEYNCGRRIDMMKDGSRRVQMIEVKRRTVNRRAMSPKDRSERTWGVRSFQGDVVKKRPKDIDKHQWCSGTLRARAVPGNKRWILLAVDKWMVKLWMVSPELPSGLNKHTKLIGV